MGAASRDRRCRAWSSRRGSGSWFLSGGSSYDGRPRGEMTAINSLTSDAPTIRHHSVTDRLGRMKQRHLGRWQLERRRPVCNLVGIGERRREVPVDGVDRVGAYTGHRDRAAYATLYRADSARSCSRLCERRRLRTAPHRESMDPRTLFGTRSLRAARLHRAEELPTRVRSPS